MTDPPDGFVLAGGASARMGVDKARSPWRGRPMALAVLEGLSAVCGRVALVRRADDGLPWPLARGGSAEWILEPPHPEPHPLWGVAAALRAARAARVVIAPCDVPGISLDSWRRLAEAGPAVAAVEGRPHPLVAVLSADQADRAERLARAAAPALALVEGLRTVELPARELVDRNRPEDLGPGPIAGLVARLPAGLPPLVVARALAGERARLRGRGVLDPAPGAGLSSPRPEEGA